MYITLIILTLIVSFGMVVFSIPPIIYISRAKNLYDVPDERKVHLTVIPNLGGVAIFIGIVLTTVLVPNIVPFENVKYILAAMVIMFFIGLKDDLIIIAPRTKFMAQIFAALVLIVLGDFRITNMHGVFGLYEINYLSSLLLTLVTIIGTINAYNLIDGIDGLASGLGLLGSAIFGTWFFITGNYNFAILAFALTGSMAGFMRYNLFSRKNKIFMGDTGSLIVGLLMSILLISFLELSITTESNFILMSPIALAHSVIFIPLTDTIRLIFLRLYRKQSPFKPDRNHLHHSLLHFFPRHLDVTMLILFINIIMIVFAFWLNIFQLKVTYQFVLLFITGFVLCMTPGLVLSYKSQRKYVGSSPEIVQHTIVSLFFTLLKINEKDESSEFEEKQLGPKE